jgi:hypothetical protein
MRRTRSAARATAAMKMLGKISSTTYRFAAATPSVPEHIGLSLAVRASRRRAMAGTAPAKLEVPDLTQAVNAVIQTFAAFVGISLTDFFDEAKNKLGEEVRLWAFIALVALLLRYIIGSAVHLNRAYGTRKGKDQPLQPSIRLFIKDLLFLVAFGYVAIQITHSYTLMHFMRWSGWFIGLGLLWSLTDWGFRRLWLPGAAGDPRLNRLAGIWAGIDAGQLGVTGLFALFSGKGMWTAACFAAVYIAIFAIDMFFLVDPKNSH